MATENEGQEPTEEEAHLVLTPAPDTDWFLQTLVATANRKGGSMGVTLLVGGTIVSGTIVSHEDYFENLGDEVEQGFKAAGGEAVSELADIFRNIGHDLEKRLAEAPPTNPAFIHLRDALIILPNKALPENRRVWWRGRISQVDGFLLGTFDPS